MLFSCMVTNAPKMEKVSQFLVNGDTCSTTICTWGKNYPIHGHVCGWMRYTFVESCLNLVCESNSCWFVASALKLNKSTSSMTFVYSHWYGSFKFGFFLGRFSIGMWLSNLWSPWFSQKMSQVRILRSLWWWIEIFCRWSNHLHKYYVSHRLWGTCTHVSSTEQKVSIRKLGQYL